MSSEPLGYSLPTQIEGVQQIMKMALNPMQTPNLDTPKYTVLKKMADYEIRRYERFTTAEVSMPSESSPASGSGFNDLAGYIFGGNREKVQATMTHATSANNVNT